MIEHRVGSESHSSAWGKFYVKGLEKFEVKEGGQRDNHNSYTTLVCLTVPDGTVFTVFDQAGDKRGTSSFDFYICQADAAAPEQEFSGGCYGTGGHIKGNFTILCEGNGTTKAPRLMNWWEKRGEKCQAWKMEDGKMRKGTYAAYAAWCAKHITVRGLGDVPPMPLEVPSE